MTSNQNIRNRKIRALDLGVCWKCMEAPPAPGKRLCTPCARVIQQKKLEKVAQRAGVTPKDICVRCRQDYTLGGSKFCVDCQPSDIKDHIDGLPGGVGQYVEAEEALVYVSEKY